MRILLLLITAFSSAFAQVANPIDPQLAKQYFAEMRALSDSDAGALWGVRLYGPMLFADPETRTVVANQADAEGRLQSRGGIFIGQLPPEVAVANTGIDWAGVRWTMVVWPLPQNRRPRKQLMAHESFHRLQPLLGFKALDANNNHLDGTIGRSWLRLEWRALNRALATSGEARRKAIADALAFRSLRRQLLPKSAENENRLEISEGIAEYTGVKLSARYPEEARLIAGVTVWQGSNRSSFVRSFAYISGPAYGVLLDESRLPWRKRLNRDSDLGLLLAKAYHLTLGKPTEPEAISRAVKYDGDEILTQENDRAVRQAKIISTQRARLIDGPVLVLPAGPEFNYSFDPNRVTPIDENTSVIDGDVRVTDAWGVLSVNSGVLFVREKGRIVGLHVPAPPDPSSLSSDGWKLDLRADWKLVSGPRPADYTVQKQ